MKHKFPLKIISSYQADRFRATTSIEKINESHSNVRKELAYLEVDYSVLIHSVNDIIKTSKKRKRIDPRLYWLIGDNIMSFLNRIEDMGFYLMQQNTVLPRDLGVSKTFIKKIITFRRRFPKLSTVNPDISWGKYKDSKVPPPFEER